MGNGNSTEMSYFRKEKLLHEYRTFYDMNRDGDLTWDDFDHARQHICKLSGWKASEDRFVKTQALFIDMWESLSANADENFDGKISEDEWVKMWEECNQRSIAEAQKAKKEGRGPKNVMPKWLDPYIWYKFHLYDRAGDGEIDVEEFEFILEKFGIDKKDARSAFRMFSKNDEKKIDLDYFRELCHEYYLSDDPSALGNFITGKLHFDTERPKCANE